MSETWLKPGTTDAMIKLPSYTVFRCDRESRTGGGVAFYVSERFNTTILGCSVRSNVVKPEFIIAEIKFNSTSKLLLAVYINLLMQVFR